jgi:hypothetical protein
MRTDHTPTRFLPLVDAADDFAEPMADELIEQQGPCCTCSRLEVALMRPTGSLAL